MMKNYGELTKKLRVLLCKAGEIMLSAHGVEAEGDIDEKSGTANFVTVFDVRVQEFLKAEILKILPDAYFIAEEQENDASSLDHDYCFIIDPIDGTANFVHGCRRSAISLAVKECGVTVFGAVYDPYLDEMFCATLGGGAFCNGAPISVGDRTPERGLAVFGTAPYQKDRYGAATFSLAERVFHTARDVRRSGSAALDLAYVAAGRYDMYFELSLSPWDIAAGLLLVSEAGGTVSDIRGDEPPLDAATSIVAASPTCYPYLLTETLRTVNEYKL